METNGKSRRGVARLTAVWILGLLALLSCNLLNDAPSDDYEDGISTGNAVADKLFNENSAVISWMGATDAPIESFAADVEIWTMYDTDRSGPVETSRYRLRVKETDGALSVRMDMDPAFNDGDTMSILSDIGEMIMFDTVTEEIRFRIPVPIDASMDLPYLKAETGISRINLSNIRLEAEASAFDIVEDTQELLVLMLPTSLFTGLFGSERISTRVVFDVPSETLREIAIEDRLEDGTRVVMTERPVYKNHEGIPIKVGLIAVIVGEAAAMYHRTTTVELYSRVGINGVPKDVFKLPSE